MNRSDKHNLSPVNTGLRSVDLDPAERVAALADSALSEADSHAVIDQLLASPELCAHWHDLHRTGDYLRSEDMASCDADTSFWHNFTARLEQEPTLLAPKPVKLSTRRTWMRYGLPGASIAAAVAMVSWLSFPQLSGNGNEVVANNGSAGSRQTLAATSSISTSSAPAYQAANAASAQPVDPRELRNYLAAHQQFSATPFRGPGAVQAASFNTIRTQD